MQNLMKVIIMKNLQIYFRNNKENMINLYLNRIRKNIRNCFKAWDFKVHS